MKSEVEIRKKIKELESLTIMFEKDPLKKLRKVN